MNPFLLKKVIAGRFLPARQQNPEKNVGVEVGDKWSGLAQPVNRISASALWSDATEGCSDVESAELAKIIRDAQIWRNPDAIKVLPELLKNGLLETVREVINWKLRLKCVLKISKARRAVYSLKIHDKLSEAFLAESPLFKRWPAHALSIIMNAAIPRALDAGEFIFHAGEPKESGVVVILSGTVKELQKRGGSSGSTGRATVIASNSATAVPHGVLFYGDLEQLTEEPHPCTVVSNTPCESWCIPHKVLTEAFATFSNEVKVSIYETVFQAKSKVLPSQLPVTPEILRGVSPIFREGTNAELDSVVSKLVPSIIQKGREIFAQGSSPSCCYILRSGTVRLVSKRSLVDGTTDTSSRTIGTVTALCEVDMMFKERLRSTAYAETHCYLYALNYSDFLSVSTFAAKAAKAATARRKEVMDKTMVSKCVVRCPLFADMSAAMLSQIVTLFEPLVHSAGELIASQADEVSQVILVAGGTAKVLDIDVTQFPKEARVYPGECIGYTGLLHQRWGYTILAATLVESWVLPFAKLRRLLKEVNLYDEVLGMSKSIFALQSTEAGRKKRFTPKTTCPSPRHDDTTDSKMGQGLWRRVPLSTKAVRIAKRKEKPEKPETPRPAKPDNKGLDGNVVLQCVCQEFETMNSQLRAMCAADVKTIRASLKQRNGICAPRAILPDMLVKHHKRPRLQHRKAQTARSPGSSAGERDMQVHAPMPPRCSSAVPAPTYQSPAFFCDSPINFDPKPPKIARGGSARSRQSGMEDLCKLDEASWMMFEKWTRSRSIHQPIAEAELEPEPSQIDGDF